MPIYNPDDLEIKMSGTAGGANHNKIYIWSDIVVPTTGNGFTFSVADAAFTTITNIQLTVENNTSSVATIPIATVKSYTSSAITVNLVVSGSTLVSLLGTTVQGLVFATNLTGVRLHARIEGF